LVAWQAVPKETPAQKAGVFVYQNDDGYFFSLIALSLYQWYIFGQTVPNFSNCGE
jgi:hypothetical protein